MRVAQIIDSLNAGGAERIAVNYANALSDIVPFSALITTRAEGVLKDQISAKVEYLFLGKKASVDRKAIFAIREFIKRNDIQVLHVHGSSFFIAFMVKLVCFKVQLIYHEHNGERIKQTFWQNMPMLFCLLFFKKIIVVNNQIRDWFYSLGYQKVIYFPNFATLENFTAEKTILKGQANKRIVCLANLRYPKNHLLLLESFSKIVGIYPDWTLHLIGKNYHDAYFQAMSNLLSKLEIEKSVFIYDAKKDIGTILEQATIGVLCSTYEGFPVTLLEYGLAKLPVVCSDVGYCSEIITDKKTGLVFASNDSKALTESILFLIANEVSRESYASALKHYVENNFSKETIVQELIEVYKNANE